MNKRRFQFFHSSTDFYFDSRFADLKKIASPRSSVLITDENVYQAHQKKFKGWNTIILNPGEGFKIQGTVDSIVEQLIEFETDRSSTIVGIGGGVITDLAGYVASIYMRGVRFGFVPTTILGLVDASIGGKNGIDIGLYKNLVGVIKQPSFVLHDIKLLDSLPQEEWKNGFAEIIKHSCIKDAAMFRELQKNDLSVYARNKSVLSALIERNARIKIKLVQQDEFEKGVRRLLNFGHTIGHAIETQYELMHGQAISIGMVAAGKISQKLLGFSQIDLLIDMLERYGLPVDADFDRKKTFDILRMDKKREKKEMNYILLQKIGKAVVQSIPLGKLEKIIQEL